MSDLPETAPEDMDPEQEAKGRSSGFPVGLALLVLIALLLLWDLWPYLSSTHRLKRATAIASIGTDWGSTDAQLKDIGIHSIQAFDEVRIILLFEREPLLTKLVVQGAGHLPSNMASRVLGRFPIDRLIEVELDTSGTIVRTYHSWVYRMLDLGP